MKTLFRKIKEKIEDFYYSLLQEFDWIQEIGFKMYLFRLFVPYWDADKIIKKLINKQFKIINVVVPNKNYKDWYSYLVGEKIQDWYSTYRFDSLEQEEVLKRYFYKIMKLHYSSSYLPSDYLIFRYWPMTALQYIFSVKSDKFERCKDFEDLNLHKELWWKLLKIIFPYVNNEENNYEKNVKEDSI